ncbi:MAG: hypothetical protein KAT71_08195 [Gammaproteobacteria bacterium]|nr:hypothetical protein [Gammaproteobacteria bacterium]
MSNKKITIYYTVGVDGTISKPVATIAKRLADFWAFAKRMAREGMQEGIVRAEYMMVWGDVLRRRKFFEGAIVPYYAIQTLERMPAPDEIRQFRLQILKELLGYSYTQPKGLNGAGELKEDRVSTTAFNEQQWDDFFEVIDHTLFAPNGFMYPDRAVYADMVADKEEGGKGMRPEQATEALRKLVLNNVIKAKV